MTNSHRKIRSFLRNSQGVIKNIIEARQASPNLLQNNKAEYDLIIREGLMSLRHYHPLQEKSIQLESSVIPVLPQRNAIPLVMIPPLGVYAWIFDLIPERSLVKFMLAHGYHVYLIDWGAPSFANADVSLEDYVLRWMPFALRAVQAHSGQGELSLLGYCMGGLLALMYLGAEQDEQVRNLITLASPVDFHQNGLMGELLTRLAAPGVKANDYINARIAKLNNTHLHIPGNALSLLFKLTNPVGAAINQLRLIRHLNDRTFIGKHISIGRWFNNMADFPGFTIQQMIEKFALGNHMAMNTLSVGTKHVDLGSITCNLLSIAGSDDTIVNANSAKMLMQLVGSDDKRFTVVKGGHAGVFAGSRAPERVWKTCAEWLSLRTNAAPYHSKRTEISH